MKTMMNTMSMQTMTAIAAPAMMPTFSLPGLSIVTPPLSPEGVVLAGNTDSIGVRDGHRGGAP